MLRKKGKKGQMEISFQMIFSLILIAAFIYAAFVGIRYFLATADQVKINSFISELQSKVDQTWMTTETSQTYKLSLPAKIKYVCFADSTIAKNMLIKDCSDFEAYIPIFKSQSMNMFFCPSKEVWKTSAPIYAKISCKGKDCLEFSGIPYCIANTKTGISITLEKTYGAKKIKLS